MKRILVVDDEELNRMSTKTVLEKAGYLVLTAESGEQGLALLQELQFDLLLLDVEMDGMNGIDMLEKIREMPRLSDMKVSVCSASSSQADMAQAVHLGIHSFIKKPCMAEELVRTVERALDDRRLPWMLVVDDEPMNQMMLKRIFEPYFQVSLASSGMEALACVEKLAPDIVIMDLNMPHMDGREAFKRMKLENPDIPVVFLTAEDDEDIELELFRDGAMDFIRRPFIAEIVQERIRRILELKRLQSVLQDEVERKANDLIKSNRKIKKLSKQIIYALAGAIDAKDTYTNGHSNRVAEYAKELALRLGKTEEEADDIYCAAMLHDVGKIGISNDIINKPGGLSPEEYEVVKSHAAKGAKILETISELPSLAVGARWHHERFDGTGYPDRLAGYDIPETARIICVADCYDAMSSNRSYRNALSQNVVRAEIEDCRGTQFDPVIADMMLQMIDEDVDYQMREKS